MQNCSLWKCLWTNKMIVYMERVFVKYQLINGGLNDTRVLLRWWFGVPYPNDDIPIVHRQGVKINKEYYFQYVIKGHLLPCAKKLFGEASFCFQQDSALAHKAVVVQLWCKQNLSRFISSFEWPASSPDLNPLEFSIWGYMLENWATYSTCVRTH